jgi:hypothetical protein
MKLIPALIAAAKTLNGWVMPSAMKQLFIVMSVMNGLM